MAVTKFTSAEAAEKARKWRIVDASGQTLGRLATEVAAILRGKDKVDFAYHTDVGDFVVVVNAAKVKLTGNKLATKIYRHHTGYIGSLKETNAEKLLAKHPERLVEYAVQGMLPKGPMGRKLVTKLKVYRDEKHPHQSQMPVAYKMQWTGKA